jgi:hypothetical protein
MFTPQTIYTPVIANLKSIDDMHALSRYRVMLSKFA